MKWKKKLTQRPNEKKLSFTNNKTNRQTNKLHLCKTSMNRRQTTAEYTQNECVIHRFPTRTHLLSPSPLVSVVSCLLIVFSTSILFILLCFGQSFGSRLNSVNLKFYPVSNENEWITHAKRKKRSRETKEQCRPRRRIHTSRVRLSALSCIACCLLLAYIRASIAIIPTLEMHGKILIDMCVAPRVHICMYLCVHVCTNGGAWVCVPCRERAKRYEPESERDDQRKRVDKEHA